MKDAYGIVATTKLNLCPTIFSVIWKWEGPERIKLLLWCIANGAILMNEARCRRRLSLDPSCPRCSSCPESINHVFRDCPVATTV